MMISSRLYNCTTRNSARTLIRPCRVWRWQANISTTAGRGRGGMYWRPAAFTLMVGGVTYSLSGIHLAHTKLHFHQRLKDLYSHNDSWITQMRRWWWELGASGRFIRGIIGINLVILVTWRIPGLSNFMIRYFTTGITNKGSLHLLLSTFSHVDFWHFAFNMIAFSSFASAAMYLLGDGVSCTNMLPFYLTAGTFASAVGHYNKLFRGNKVGSLGASGALMAVAGLVILADPNSRVALIFLPFFPIKAGTALGGVVLLDTIGVLRGWKFFDHAAHLGGVFFAFVYGAWLHKVGKAIQTKSANLWMKLNSKRIT